MNIEVKQQNLNNIVRGIEEIKEDITNMNYNDFSREDQIKESVYANLQMIGEAAHELSQSSDNAADLNFNTDVLASFRNARFNQEAEVGHQQTWNIINSELDIIHEEAIKASADLGTPDSEW